jgi:hypothetical protein
VFILYIIYSAVPGGHLPDRAASALLLQRQLGRYDLPALCLDLLNRLFLLVVDHSLLLKIFHLQFHVSAGRLEATVAEAVPSYVHSFSRTLDLLVHMQFVSLPCRPLNLCCRGCCFDQGIRKRHRGPRNISPGSFLKASQMRRRKSSWGPSRPTSRRKVTKPWCEDGRRSKGVRRWRVAAVVSGFCCSRSHGDNIQVKINVCGDVSQVQSALDGGDAVA